MELDELEGLLDKRKSLFDFRSEKVFKQMDNNKSDSLDKAEIQAYMKEAMGDSYSEDFFESEFVSTFNVNTDNDASTFNMDEFK
mmetsp:Transcript_12612/g.19887  ORF Transcript_12612/g.19887 Transcript_12612/m.19887 type:complete len:84 (+) Transcript_12612:705-956(+)